jgi:hypothetical protein
MRVGHSQEELQSHDEVQKERTAILRSWGRKGNQARNVETRAGWGDLYHFASRTHASEKLWTGVLLP